MSSLLWCLCCRRAATGKGQGGRSDGSGGGGAGGCTLGRVAAMPARCVRGVLVRGCSDMSAGTMVKAAW